jgi:hypothetical protein
MTFELRREREHGRVVERVGVGDEHACGEQARHDGGRRGAHPPSVRDPVGAREVQPRPGCTRVVERDPQCAHDEVPLVVRNLSCALAGHVDTHLRRSERTHLEGVVVAESEAERVETGTEVGAGRGDAYADVVRSELHGRLRPAGGRRRWRRRPP